MKFTAYSTTSTGWVNGRPASASQLAEAGISLIATGCPEHPSKWLVDATDKEDAVLKLTSFMITVPDSSEYCFSGRYGVYEA